MKKIFLWILVIIIIILALVGVIYKRELSAIYNITFVSPEKAITKLLENKEQLKNELKTSYEMEDALIEGFTDEEMEKITKGEMTVDEAMERLEADINAQQAETPVKDDNTQKIKQAISDSATKLYRAKAEYSTALASLETEVPVFYRDLRKQKISSAEAKAKVISRYLPVLSSLSKDADAKVAEILSNLNNTLKSLNGDTSIVDKMKAEYESEKAAKQSEYMSIWNSVGKKKK